MLEVSKDEKREVRIGGGEGGEKFLESSAKFGTVLEVGRVRSLDGIDVDDSKSVLRAKGESGHLDAIVTVWLMIQAVKWYDGGGTKEGDCFWGIDCGVATCLEKLVKG